MANHYLNQGKPRSLKHFTSPGCIMLKYIFLLYINTPHCKSIPDSNVRGANMGPTWVLSASDGPHVGPMNLAIWDGVKIYQRWRQWKTTVFIHHSVLSLWFWWEAASCHDGWGRFGPSQWETALRLINASRLLGANLESGMIIWCLVSCLQMHTP